VDWLSARWRPHYQLDRPLTPRTFRTLREAGLPIVRGKDQRRPPWTHTHLVAALIAVHEGLIEPPPAWLRLTESPHPTPAHREAAYLQLLRAALPGCEAELFGWEMISLWLEMLRWRTHNNEAAPRATYLSHMRARWGLPVVLVHIPGKSGRSIMATNYQTASRYSLLGAWCSNLATSA